MGKAFKFSLPLIKDKKSIGGTKYLFSLPGLNL